MLVSYLVSAPDVCMPVFVSLHCCRASTSTPPRMCLYRC